MTFVDITVVPVGIEHRDAYVAFAQRMAEVYRDHGALRVVDYWQADAASGQDDFHASGTAHEEGELRGLAELAGATVSEAVVVTVTEWSSRESRDRGTAATTSDPRVLATLDEDPVFDGARLAGGCFEIATRAPDASSRPEVG